MNNVRVVGEKGAGEGDGWMGIQLKLINFAIKMALPLPPSPSPSPSTGNFPLKCHPGAPELSKFFTREDPKYLPDLGLLNDIFVIPAVPNALGSVS